MDEQLTRMSRGQIARVSQLCGDYQRRLRSLYASMGVLKQTHVMVDSTLSQGLEASLLTLDRLIQRAYHHLQRPEHRADQQILALPADDHDREDL